MTATLTLEAAKALHNECCAINAEEGFTDGVAPWEDVSPEEKARYLRLVTAVGDVYGSELLDEAEFLCARLRELECSIFDDEVGTEYYGHAAPSRSRLEAIIGEVRAAQGQAK